jgi:hypothetical protein
MEHICKEHLPDIDGDVVLQLIEFSVEEMIQSPDYQPDQQMPASGILVALGQAYCNEVCTFHYLLMLLSTVLRIHLSFFLGYFNNTFPAAYVCGINKCHEDSNEDVKGSDCKISLSYSKFFFKIGVRFLELQHRSKQHRIEQFSIRIN